MRLGQLQHHSCECCAWQWPPQMPGIPHNFVFISTNSNVSQTNNHSSFSHLSRNMELCQRYVCESVLASQYVWNHHRSLNSWLNAAQGKSGNSGWQELCRKNGLAGREAYQSIQKFAFQHNICLLVLFSGLDFSVLSECDILFMSFTFTPIFK